MARLRELVWGTYPHACMYCKTPLTWGSFTVEHRLPRSRGGSNELPNLGPCCGPCNFGRGNRAAPRARHVVDDRAFFGG